MEGEITIVIYMIAFIVAATALLLLLYYIIPFRTSYKAISRLWIIYIIAFAALAYHCEPSPSTDLYRLYQEIDTFRYGNASIFGGPYIVMNLVYWIVAKFPSNGWFPVFTILIWGFCTQGIVKKYTKNRPFPTRQVIMYYLAANGGVFVVYLISGNRSTMVASLWCYAYYSWYEKEKSKYYIVMAVCAFVHLLTLILVGLTLLFGILNRRKSAVSYVITFGVVIVIGYVISSDMSHIAALFGTGGIYFENLYSKILVYSNRDSSFQQGREMMLRIIGALYLFLCIILLHKEGNKKYDIIGFLILIMFAGFKMSILFERMPYVLGCACLPILIDLMSNKHRKEVNNIVLRNVGFVVFLAQAAWGAYETILWLDFA